MTLAAEAYERPHWHYGYDAYGNQISQTDADNHTTTFTYDALGRRISRTLPGKERDIWAYDANGNVTLHKVYGVDPNGNTSTVASLTVWDIYDTSAAHGGRLLAEYRFNGDFTPTSAQVANPETTSYQERTLYTYDDATDASGHLGLGGILELRDSSLQPTGQWLEQYTTTTYDPVTGQVASLTTPQGTIHYRYDTATGRKLEMWTDSGTDESYQYDSQGRLWQLS